MAEKLLKYTKNIPGNFFVDTTCIGCNACVLEAPEFFKIYEKDLQAYVTRQPKNLSEKELCHQALMYCPVEAIGADL
jgi:ferredoxin